MDAQATPSRLARLVHHAVVAALRTVIDEGSSTTARTFNDHEGMGIVRQQPVG